MQMFHQREICFPENLSTQKGFWEHVIPNAKLAEVHKMSEVF